MYLEHAMRLELCANGIIYYLTHCVLVIQTNGIRIKKPITELVFDYCVKIVSHQQVDTLYIEQHRFTASELFNLTMLCKNKQVNLVHLTKAPYEQSNNIIYGPW